MSELHCATVARRKKRQELFSPAEKPSSSRIYRNGEPDSVLFHPIGKPACRRADLRLRRRIGIGPNTIQDLLKRNHPLSIVSPILLPEHVCQAGKLRSI